MKLSTLRRSALQVTGLLSPRNTGSELYFGCLGLRTIPHYASTCSYATTLLLLLQCTRPAGPKSIFHICMRPHISRAQELHHVHCCHATLLVTLAI